MCAIERETLTRRNFTKLALTASASFAVAASTGILTGCGSKNSETATAVTDSSTVIVAMTTASEPEAGFDPIYGWGCGEHVHEPLIQSTLIVTTKEMGFANDLATEYSCSDDGLSWSFSIRDDVRFSNGDPLTAADVAFTINEIRMSDGSVADLTMVADAIAVDDTHIQIMLNKPFNALLYTLAVVGIVPEAAYSDTYGQTPIGSGRYLLEQWDRGQQAIFSANPDYYGDAPLMQRLVVLFMDEDAALAGCRSGEIDIAYTSAIYSDQRIDGYNLLAMETVDSRGISLPCVSADGTKADGDNTYALGNDVSSDIAIRRAMNYALDRTTMVANVLNGYGTPAFSVSDGMPWASDDMRCDMDVNAAQKMLADAGWVAGSDGVLVKGGLRASLDLYYAASDSTRQALAAEFSNQMKQLGISINYKGESWDVIYTHEFSDLILWGWGSNSPAEVYDLNYSTGWGNFASYGNTTIDRHLDDALATPQVEDSYEDWQLAQWDGIQGFAPKGAATWVWLANIQHLYFSRDGLNVADQKRHPHGHGWSLVNNVDQWTWE